MNFKDYLVTDLSTLQKGQPVIVVVTQDHMGKKGWDVVKPYHFKSSDIILSSWYFECWDTWAGLVCIENPNIEEGGVLYLDKKFILVYNIDWYELYPNA